MQFLRYEYHLSKLNILKSKIVLKTHTNSKVYEFKIRNKLKKRTKPKVKALLGALKIFYIKERKRKWVGGGCYGSFLPCDRRIPAVRCWPHLSHHLQSLLCIPKKRWNLNNKKCPEIWTKIKFRIMWSSHSGSPLLTTPQPPPTSANTSKVFCVVPKKWNLNKKCSEIWTNIKFCE